MTRYQRYRIITAYGQCVLLALILAVLALISSHLGAIRPVAPLVSPPYCEGAPDTGFCCLDLSDGREYVVYTDPSGQLAWYVQDWKDGTP